MAKRKFDCAGFPCEPHDVTDDAWYYVQKTGIALCHRVNGQPGEIILIPWKMIKRALADREKAKSRRPSPRGGE